MFFVHGKRFVYLSQSNQACVCRSDGSSRGCLSPTTWSACQNAGVWDWWEGDSGSGDKWMAGTLDWTGIWKSQVNHNNHSFWQPCIYWRSPGCAQASLRTKTKECSDSVCVVFASFHTLWPWTVIMCTVLELYFSLSWVLATWHRRNHSLACRPIILDLLMHSY